MEFNPREAALLLLATIGPLKVTIVCATMTTNASPEFLRRLALRSVLTALIACIVFALIGEAILVFFKVSIPAFQIGGGIIVLLSSIEMVMGGKQAHLDVAAGSEKENSEPSLDMAVYPLAIPMMASVSGLVAIVSLLSQQTNLWALIFVLAVIATIMALDYVCLRACRFINKALGTTVLQVIGKLMGVILTALAIELILMGARGLGLVPPKPDAYATSAAPSPGMNTPVALKRTILESFRRLN
jgi:multiple antibiotic resistance protein